MRLNPKTTTHKVSLLNMILCSMILWITPALAEEAIPAYR